MTTSSGPDARPRREMMSCKAFAKTLGTHGSPCERVVVCLVHDDDNNPLDEPFYLARIVSKARRIVKDYLASTKLDILLLILSGIHTLIVVVVIVLIVYNQVVRRVWCTVWDRY